MRCHVCNHRCTRCNPVTPVARPRCRHAMERGERRVRELALERLLEREALLS
jgi:hypothetical protein